MKDRRARHGWAFGLSTNDELTMTSGRAVRAAIERGMQMEGNLTDAVPRIQYMELSDRLRHAELAQRKAETEAEALRRKLAQAEPASGPVEQAVDRMSDAVRKMQTQLHIHEMYALAQKALQIGAVFGGAAVYLAHRRSWFVLAPIAALGFYALVLIGNRAIRLAALEPKPMVPHDPPPPPTPRMVG